MVIFRRHSILSAPQDPAKVQKVGCVQTDPRPIILSTTPHHIPAINVELLHPTAPDTSIPHHTRSLYTSHQATQHTTPYYHAPPYHTQTTSDNSSTPHHITHHPTTPHNINHTLSHPTLSYTHHITSKQHYAHYDTRTTPPSPRHSIPRYPPPPPPTLTHTLPSIPHSQTFPGHADDIFTGSKQVLYWVFLCGTLTLKGERGNLCCLQENPACKHYEETHTKRKRGAPQKTG